MIRGIHYFSAEVKPKLMSSQGTALIMDPDPFNKILERITPRIKKLTTNYKKPIPAGLRLAATLSFRSFYTDLACGHQGHELFVSRWLCGWYVSRFGSSVSQFASCVSQFWMVRIVSYVIWTVRPIRHGQHTNRVSTSGAGTHVSDYNNVNVIRTVWMSCIHYGPCVDVY